MEERLGLRPLDTSAHTAGVPVDPRHVGASFREAELTDVGKVAVLTTKVGIECWQWEVLV